MLHVVFLLLTIQNVCFIYLFQDQSNRNSYQERKDGLLARLESAKREKLHEHDIVRNAELRKFRREQLLQRQDLEKVLLTEVRVADFFHLRHLCGFCSDPSYSSVAVLVSL